MKKYLIIFLLLTSTTPFVVLSYGECDQYGVMAMYESYSSSCKCMSGYIFGKNFMGEPYCVSADTVCHDKYGYNSRYNSINNSCECGYGYMFGKDSIGRTQCVSESDICRDNLGYNSRYNSLSDKCECSYGYVINGGKCEDGDSVCHDKHGYHSSYEDYSNSCKCDSDYTLDNSNQCVEKQNNVYFKLKELDTDEKKAIVRSDYDSRYYLISYNSGCYASSFKRYLNQQIVINLGTDFDLDTWDKIVLQDDDENCDITRVERADSSTTLQPQEEDTTSYFPPPQNQIKTITESPRPVPIPIINTKKIVKKEKDIVNTKKATSSLKEVSTSTKTILEETSLLKKIWKFIWRF